MAISEGDIPWDKLREAFPEIPENCIALKIEIAEDSIPVIEVKFHPKKSESKWFANIGDFGMSFASEDDLRKALEIAVKAGIENANP